MIDYWSLWKFSEINERSHPEFYLLVFHSLYFLFLSSAVPSLTTNTRTNRSETNAFNRRPCLNLIWGEPWKSHPSYADLMTRCILQRCQWDGKETSKVGFPIKVMEICKFSLYFRSLQVKLTKCQNVKIQKNKYKWQTYWEEFKRMLYLFSLSFFSFDLQ